METDEPDIDDFYDRFRNGFRHNNQDPDVTIQCIDHKFKCHRAVLAAGSTYFARQFNNDAGTENVTESVIPPLHHSGVDALVEILNYFYTGDVKVTLYNFMDLLYTSKYLGVPELEAPCIRFMLQNRPWTSLDLLEVLFFAHRGGNHSLIDVLATCNLTERFKEFFGTGELLYISKDQFLTIVKLWKSPPIMYEVLRRAIYSWGIHALKEREMDVPELYDFMESAISEISLDHSIRSSHSLLQSGSDLLKIVAATPSPSLYVYSIDKDHSMNVYRYNKKRRFKKFDLEHSFIQDSKIRAPRFVSVDNVGVFSMAHESDECFYPTFTQFASVNLGGFEHQLALASPPVDLWHTFDLCNLSNHGLYLLLRMRCLRMPPVRNPRYDPPKQEFSDDEIQRGIYYYNIELDRWYPVPAMISHPFYSCMTVQDKNLVYVISSRDDRKMVQAYDHRESQWHRKPNILNIHTDAQSCVLDGSIYVRSPEYCERYDPIAGRWQNIRGFEISDHEVQRLIPYNNKLWQFRKRDLRKFHNFGVLPHLHHIIDVYDPCTASWSSMKHSIPGVADFKTADRPLYEKVVDAVVW